MLRDFIWGEQTLVERQGKPRSWVGILKLVFLDVGFTCISFSPSFLCFLEFLNRSPCRNVFS